MDGWMERPFGEGAGLPEARIWLLAVTSLNQGLSTDMARRKVDASQCQTVKWVEPSPPQGLSLFSLLWAGSSFQKLGANLDLAMVQPFGSSQMRCGPQVNPGHPAPPPPPMATCSEDIAIFRLHLDRMGKR